MLLLLFLSEKACVKSDQISMGENLTFVILRGISCEYGDSSPHSMSGVEVCTWRSQVEYSFGRLTKGFLWKQWGESTRLYPVGSGSWAIISGEFFFVQTQFLRRPQLGGLVSCQFYSYKYKGEINRILAIRISCD